MTILETIDLYILNGALVWYVNDISIKLSQAVWKPWCNSTNLMLVSSMFLFQSRLGQTPRWGLSSTQWNALSPAPRAYDFHSCHLKATSPRWLSVIQWDLPQRCCNFIWVPVSAQYGANLLDGRVSSSRWASFWIIQWPHAQECTCCWEHTMNKTQLRL